VCNYQIYKYESSPFAATDYLITLVFRKCFDYHILVIMALWFLNEAHHQAQIHIHERRANRRRNRAYALQEMEEMTEMHFKRMFRMSKFELLIKLEDHYDGPTDENAAENSSGEIVNKINAIS
jgi:outer membrane phospholipase A